MKLLEVMLGDSVGILSLLTVVFAILIILFLGAFFLFGSDKSKGDSK
ncbi:DUF3149 domain-containing protein [Thioflexithrix psekupsensis]|nr:DUF3149 domain-containing protein [Thioflexithrix psekupsensis]